MKKFITLLLLTLTAFTLKTQAQTTVCNAEFSVQYLTNFNVKFNPVITIGSPTYQHIWHFGDGSPVSNTVSPTHTYAAAGTYTTVHTIIRYNQNNVPECTQSFTKIVQIQQACNLVADFSWLANPANPLSIQFTNLSVPLANTDSIKWTFGDGTTSNQINPLHVYAAAGTYTVCLRIIKYNVGSTTPCIREICKTVVVTAPCNLQAYFSSQNDPNNPLKVYFTNQSVPSHHTDSVKWTFGDGTSISGLQSDPNVANPVHIYAHAGTYNVCIRVKKNNSTTANQCVREFCKTVVVTAPCTLVADFSAQPVAGTVLTIKFTNLSTPSHASDSLKWTFGDGTSLSGLQSDPNVANPTHQYSQAGNYTVCLRVKTNLSISNTNICVKEVCKTVTVIHPCNFQASFTWRADSANYKKIHFTNTTNAPTAASTATWTFGDGTTATTWNAVHEYAQPGSYRVCLRVVSGPNCVREYCDTVVIHTSPPPCNNQSNFNFIRTTNNSQTYTFIPAYQSNTVQYTWTFGDGTGSRDMIATHHYAQPGTYTVCLTVWRSATCASTTCKTIQVTPQINCDTVHVTYNYQRDPQVPNKIYFNAVSNLPILDQTWTITRLPGSVNTAPIILHQNNPVYTFGDTGTYRVCLRAITLGGCVKEFCREIRITHLAPTNACNLVAFPNPASTMVNVNVNLTQPEMIHTYIYNSLNVLVLDKHQQGFTGNNLVSVNVSALPVGQYIMKVIYGNRTCFAPFQKL